MSYQDSLKNLTDFLVRKFHHPNFDHRYLGGPSEHVQTERDLRWTLNSLQGEQEKIKRNELLNQLEGHVQVLGTVGHFSSTELDEILEKINNIRQEI
jgi:hypothetical protein